MNRQSAFAVACAVSATTVLGVVASPAGALTLGEPIIVGEKKFTFTECFIVRGGNQNVSPGSCDDIGILPILGEHQGISIRSPFIAFDDSSIDVSLEYILEKADPDSDSLFTDAKLFFNGAFTGPGLTNVTETFFDADTDEVIGQFGVTNPPPDLMDPPLETVFPFGGDVPFSKHVAKVKVKKDIGLVAFEGAQANISIIDQTFKHKDVPEPGTVTGLLAIGSLSVGAMLKRHFGKKA
ncbi:MAG: PEP-CTERM sorting domain-containing protein [Coleofasciculus sp. B1-GNL1-01]|uniref:PEP-CTERM sorting domain-containing protein n=1 Tax=Coleofasciculus sp. B1-GNL1-01 TaxID=3068484 RepID=UPI003300B2F1